MTSLSVRAVDDGSVWKNVVAACRPHTFLQSWGWGLFHAATGTEALHLGVYEEDTLIATALVLCIRAKRGSFLFCPHGPTVVRQEDTARVLEVLTHDLRTRALKEGFVFIRFSPLMAASAEQEQLFRSQGYRRAPTFMHPEFAWLLDLQPSEEELMRQMRKTTRYSIRKAETDGVTIRLSRTVDDLEVFWDVYQATVDRQHFTPFSKEYLRREFELLREDADPMFVFGSYEGRVISAALIILYGDAAYYHHGASNQINPKITASYLVQWHAIQEAKRRGCRYYNFWGIAPEDQPQHPWAGLSLFKRGFGGFSEAYVPAQDLPLSWKYAGTYMIERVRRWKRGV
jgi:peptidoglycan pentaglycine glycine transferase (the first glycine)